jgi:prophage antirepressor-like protein
MSDLKVFENEKFGQVRVVDRDGEPWFVAKGVCDILGYSDVSNACRVIDEDEKIVLTREEVPSFFEETSSAPVMTLISESGLYTLVLRSNKPEAKAFRKWVTSEVLPSIRKRGVYATQDFIQKSIEDPDWAISMLLQVKHEREQRQLAEKQRDEAVRTKAWIGSRREATAMNTASQKSKECVRKEKECEKLREQIGDSTNWKAVRAIPWLKQYFALSVGLFNAVAQKLRKICIEFNLERRDIEDSKWGTIKAYPVEAIDILHMRIMDDRNMLAKYRLAE